MDSNSVWDPLARTWHQRVGAQPQQALLMQVQEMLHGVRLQSRAASLPQVEHVEVQQEHVDAQEAWRRLDLAQEKSLRAQPVERSPASELPVAEELLQRALLRQRSREALPGGLARKQQERVEAESQEEAEELPQRASCVLLWRPLLSLPYPILPSVRPLLRHWRPHESARAPLPRLLPQSSWNAFFSR